MKSHRLVLFLLSLLILTAPCQGQIKADEPPQPNEESVNEGPDAKGIKRVAAVSSIEPEELLNFDHYAPQIQQLIRNALELTKLNLTYTFGASTPSEGGMDCSGTIVHLLQGLGMKGVPRQSDAICAWVQDRTLLHRIGVADKLSGPEFAALQPGDLLFWSGTYVTLPRKIPVTHVMLYLGKLKKTGKHVVFGASDGRYYQGQRRTGVSVFDFTLPKTGSKSSLYGYGLIPGIGKVEVKPLDPVTIAMAAVEKVLPPPAKETLNAKDGVTPLKTDTAKTDTAKTDTAKTDTAKTDTAKTDTAKTDTAATTKEEVRRASPAVAAAEVPAETPAAQSKSTAAKTTGTAKKSSSPKTTAKPKSAPSKPKTSAQRRTPPPPPTAQQRFENAANRMASSIRQAFQK